jgi:hypothetical protein
MSRLIRDASRTLLFVSVFATRVIMARRTARIECHLFRLALMVRSGDRAESAFSIDATDLSHRHRACGSSSAVQSSMVELRG